MNGYHCDCVPGYYGNQCEAEHDECMSQPCIHGNCVVCITCYLIVFAVISLIVFNPLRISLTGTSVSVMRGGLEWTVTRRSTSVSPVHVSMEIAWYGIKPQSYSVVNSVHLIIIIINMCTCQDLVSGYMCACEPGWTGMDCGQDINECDPIPCRNGATCIVSHR